MSNQLKMAEHQAILGLARLNWSYRRIAAELGVDRETVARHVKAASLDVSDDPTVPEPPEAGSNAAIVITGTVPELPEAAVTSNAAIPVPELPAAGRQSRCHPWRENIVQGLEQGLTARRIWQDLAADHGFVGDYQSVQRFVRRLKSRSPLPFRRMECAAGAEAQVDFGKGAAVATAEGKRSRPHLFRVVLSCSRKAYSEVVPRQTTEAFIRCLENAFVFFGGVPRTLVVDNLKAAVIKADWYDPELNPKIQAFAAHYGTVVLPTRSYTPRHKGKVERGVGYAQDRRPRWPAWHHGLRAIMGLVGLTHRHPTGAIEEACRVAQSHGAHRLRDIRNLLKRAESAAVQQQFDFVAEHPLIRSLSDYSKLIHTAFEETPS
jgi:transposase